MDIFIFLREWFQSDLAFVGTVLITIIASIVFIYEVIQKIRNNKNVEAILFFIAYLITVFGLLLIILQSLHNIESSNIIETRLDNIEKYIKLK